LGFRQRIGCFRARLGQRRRLCGITREKAVAKLTVDASDVPRIEILDANGATVYALPPSSKP